MSSIRNELLRIGSQLVSASAGMETATAASLPCPKGDNPARRSPPRMWPITCAQQGLLLRPADEVGEPAARGLEAAFNNGDALHRECFNRLGEAPVNTM